MLRDSGGEFTDLDIAIIEHNADPVSTKDEKVSETWNPKPVFCAKENEVC